MSPRVAVAPGRVNLIGEHTDYNEGFVLPMALDRQVAVAFARRGDDILRVHAAAFRETRELSLARLQDRPANRRDAKGPRGGWFAYVDGLARALLAAGLPLRGADLLIVSDLPIGAGLSSSAALEIAVARALVAAAELAWDPMVMARIARQAENEFVGVACGIMDQLASALGAEGCAILIDCRSLETREVPLPDAAHIVVMDTGVRRSLAASAYNDRRAACERAVQMLRQLEPRIRALRDVDAALLERARPGMDPVTFRRAAHVVAENLRPVAMAVALAAGDLGRAGELMNESHAGLRDLYGVSGPELDLLVDLARAHPACFGARLTGAGFGGCAIALVATDAAEDLAAWVSAGYRERTGRTAPVFVCRPSAGARLIE